MHFWIDKRSQCSYNGRHRVPSSLSAGVGVGVGRGHGRVCAAGGRKGMAAPVHRFQPVDPPRRPRTNRQYGPPPMPPVHSRRPNTDSLYVEIPQPPAQPPQPTIASLAAARSVTPDTLLRTAALGLHHSPMMAPHLKFGMLVSFALATVFLAGAKYYFDRQVMRAGGGGAGGGNSSSGEAGVVCAAVACVCGVGCALSLCRARPPPPAPPDRVSSTARRRPADLAPPPAPAPAQHPQRPPQEPEDISLIPLPREEPPTVSTEGGGSPPPYHIAVLLPAPSPPPPAYSALS